jgi:hypothetical protein
MTPDERERMAILCERLAKEQDPCKYTEFVEQLNSLLEAKERRLDFRKTDKTSSTQC